METEDVASETPAEPPTEEGDGNTEDKKEHAEHGTDNNKEEAVNKIEEEPAKVKDEPPCDWLEPLEEDCDEDDDQSFDQDGTRDAEMESLAGSERSGSVAGVRKERRGRPPGNKRKRKPLFDLDESWEDCPELGIGWKRKEVFRRSGTSEGRSDTYYISPRGNRVRSKVELSRYVFMDLSKFDFKSGKFLDAAGRKRAKKKTVDSFQVNCAGDESVDPGDRAYSPSSSTSLSHSPYQRSSPTLSHKDVNTRTMTPPRRIITSVKDSNFPNITLQSHCDPTNLSAPSLGGSLSRTPDGSVNGVAGSSAKPILYCVCTRCNKTIPYVEGNTMCQNCRNECNTLSVSQNKPSKKWVACGQCRACQSTVGCGKCANCKNGRRWPNGKLPKCRKLTCVRPMLRKNPPISKEQFSNTIGSMDTVSIFSKPSVSDFEESQSSLLHYSDSEDLSLFLADNDDDFGFDEVVGKVRRRSCGKCRGCIRSTDCGTCDFCMDKPKFGGRNKKRQKCRLRQCQREAMKHLLPMHKNQRQIRFARGWVTHNREGTHYTPKRGRPKRGKSWNLLPSDDEADQYRRAGLSSGAARVVDRSRLYLSNYSEKAYPYTDPYPNIANNGGLNNFSLYSTQKNERQELQHEVLSAAGRENVFYPPRFVEEKRSRGQEQEDESTPTITQIFSLGDSDPSTQGIDLDHELLHLLRSLRSTVLPVLWFCIAVEGPRLQLMQCSKRSAMADTILQIEPNFHYHISVQGQPLLPTHELYDTHPPCLTAVEDIVTLLEDLERHSICQGFKNKVTTAGPEPVVLERAATCDFLISAGAERCAGCSDAA